MALTYNHIHLSKITDNLSKFNRFDNLANEYD